MRIVLVAAVRIGASLLAKGAAALLAVREDLLPCVCFYVEFRKFLCSKSVHLLIYGKILYRPTSQCCIKLVTQWNNQWNCNFLEQ